MTECNVESNVFLRAGHPERGLYPTSLEFLVAHDGALVIGPVVKDEVAFQNYTTIRGVPAHT